MNIENTKAQMRRCSRVLHLICIKRKDAYTSEILDTLKNAKLLVVEGTIYPLLTRLKNDGLLSYRWEESIRTTQILWSYRDRNFSKRT
jgi:PadR family transcriptional regulator PadR